MNFTQYLYKGMTSSPKGVCIMAHDTYYFSLLDGIGNADKQDKKTVVEYLNKHPKLEKRKGEKGYFLKGYDFILSPAIKLGTTACYFADNFWCWDIKDFNDYYNRKRLYFNDGSGGGSGSARMFYAYLYPEVIDALIDRMCKNADAIVEIAKDPNKYKEKIKLDKMEKDF